MSGGSPRRERRLLRDDLSTQIGMETQRRYYAMSKEDVAALRELSSSPDSGYFLACAGIAVSTLCSLITSWLTIDNEMTRVVACMAFGAITLAAVVAGLLFQRNARAQRKAQMDIIERLDAMQMYTPDTQGRWVQVIDGGRGTGGDLAG